MEKMTTTLSAVMCAGAVTTGCVLTSCGADGTLVSSGAPAAYRWTRPDVWREASVPGGVGSTITLGDSTVMPNQISLDTNAVVGAIVVPSDIKTFTDIRIIKAGAIVPKSDGEAPVLNGKGLARYDNYLTFDNGDSAARLTSECTDKYGRVEIVPPIRLASPLAVSMDYEQLRPVLAPENPSNYAKLFDNCGWWANFLLCGKISDADGQAHAVTFDGGSRSGGLLLACPDNDFAGDITVVRGILRAYDPLHEPGHAGTPFGKGAKTIAATSGSSVVDLGGYVMGESQTLRLSGKPSVCLGTLINLQADPGRTSARWLGAVEISGATAIGGSLDYKDGSAEQEVIGIGGSFAVDGPVTGDGSIEILGHHTVEFSNPYNDYSGDTTLSSGAFRLTKGAKIGRTGRLVFNGGVYKVERDDDVDLSSFTVVANDKIRIDVDEGVTYMLAHPLNASDCDIVVTGRGKLVLTQPVVCRDVYLEGGELVLEYGQDVNASEILTCMAPVANGAAHGIFCYGNSRVTVRGNTCWGANLARTTIHQIPTVVAPVGHTGTLANESTARLRSLSYNHKELGVLSFEDPNNLGLQTTYEANGGTSRGLSTGGHPFVASPLAVCNRMTWLYYTKANDADGCRIASGYPDENYISEWSHWSKGPEEEWSGSYGLVDVKESMLNPDAARVCGLMRFNTPVNGDPDTAAEMVLTLTGDNILKGGGILVTPNMGKTTVRITGGALKCGSFGGSATRAYVFYNFNTNAALIIESDLPQSSDGTAGIYLRGPGKIVLAGSNSFSQGVYAHDGEVEIKDAGAFGTAYGITLNGATLAVRHSVDLTGKQLTLYPAGGGISVPKECTLTSPNAVVTYGGGRFWKKGAGEARLKGFDIKNRASFLPGTFAARYAYDVRVEEGRFGPVDPQMYAFEFFQTYNGGYQPFGHRSVIVLLGDGAELVGGGLMCSNPDYVDGSVNYLFGKCRQSEVGARIRYRIDDGATVRFDALGVSMTMDNVKNEMTTGESNGEERPMGFISGTNCTVEVYDSTKTPGVTINYAGMLLERFFGRFVSSVPAKSAETGAACGCGLLLPHAAFEVPSGTTTQFRHVYPDAERLSVARLAGTGVLSVSPASLPATFYSVENPNRGDVLYVGEDSSNENVFDGTLQLQMASASVRSWLVGSGCLVKVGSNRLKLTNGANVFEAATTIMDGSIAVGADGALGKADVIVGGHDTPASATVSLVADGAAELSNALYVPSSSPASARPTVGGEQTVEFTGAVKAFRPFALYAGSGATVTFSGALEGVKSYSLAGTGTVKVGSSFANGLTAWTGGTLDVDGDYVIETGAILDVSGATLDRHCEYDVLVADSISGKFTLRGLDEAAGGWKLSRRTMSDGREGLVLCRTKGMMVILR